MSVLRSITIDAKPGALDIDIAQAVVLVVDMQNDFGAQGGLMHRAGIDIGPIQATVQPTAQVLAAARQAGIRIVYLKMEFRPDLSDAGAADSPNASGIVHSDAWLLAPKCRRDFKGEALA